MIHHSCAYASAEIGIIKALSDKNQKATMAVMGYDGRYRCAECKRRVEIDVSDATYERDLQLLPKAEPPYPDGWCK